MRKVKHLHMFIIYTFLQIMMTAFSYYLFIFSLSCVCISCWFLSLWCFINKNIDRLLLQQIKRLICLCGIFQNDAELLGMHLPVIVWLLETFINKDSDYDVTIIWPSWPLWALCPKNNNYRPFWGGPAVVSAVPEVFHTSSPFLSVSLRDAFSTVDEKIAVMCGTMPCPESCQQWRTKAWILQCSTLLGCTLYISSRIVCILPCIYFHCPYNIVKSKKAETASLSPTLQAAICDVVKVSWTCLKNILLLVSGSGTVFGQLYSLLEDNPRNMVPPICVFLPALKNTQ